MPLFEVAVIEAAAKKKDEEHPERLVIAPKHVLAKDGQQAAMKFVVEFSDVLKAEKVDHDRMQVLVRPFA